jgi:hypothetical protein
MRAAMRLPIIEGFFPEPWSAAARRTLTSPSPATNATAMWGPILSWCVIDLLAESLNSEDREQVALDLFDRLRLREPIAQAHSALGLEADEGWRVAARIKVGLLINAGVGKEAAVHVPAVEALATDPTDRAPAGDFSLEELGGEEPRPEVLPESSELSAGEVKVGLAPGLWSDPDVRWLSGVHESEGWHYVVQEQYEELLWWLLMPELLKMAAVEQIDRASVEELGSHVEDALELAEEARYRVEILVGGPDAGSLSDAEAEAGIPPTAPVKAEPAESSSDEPAGE